MSTLLVADKRGKTLLRKNMAGRQRLSIGTSRQCHLSIRANSISKRHGLFFRHAHRWWVIDTASRHGTWIGPDRVLLAPFPDDSWVRLGPAYLWIEPRDDDPPATPSPSLAAPGPFLALSDPVGFRLIHIDLSERDLLTIGRSEACDLVLPDPCLADLHLILYREARQWYAADCGSQSGTRLGRVKLQWNRFRPHTLLQVGAAVGWLSDGPARSPAALGVGGPPSPEEPDLRPLSAFLDAEEVNPAAATVGWPMTRRAG